ncbi:type II toxin-antitoxin system Phd/YefM family antitoxin [Pseudomonas syringae]|uniref:type II toxin-antitoxin system Phd/YefM family antitoxin n=1 Tax=Pseudomonas syringae TaxID=317 RepID=UPI001F169984|nr:type II toxin-antitoxin system Phd/YefM family antitoxin [Pseudomonas syringae]
MDFLYRKQSRAERVASASRQAVFDSSPGFGYIWPRQGEIQMTTVPLGEAKTNLSKLVDEAAAGKIITISKHGRAIAQLVPIAKPKRPRIGAMKDMFVTPDNFDDPLPEDLLDAFEGNPS